MEYHGTHAGIFPSSIVSGAGRVLQMAVLLDDMEKATALPDGKNSTASKLGTIRYYNDSDITDWNSSLKLIDSYGIRTFWDLRQNQ